MGDISITKNICFSSLRVGCEEDEIGRSLYFENNGRKLLEIIKIHPGINDEKIYKAMKKMNELAKKQD